MRKQSAGVCDRSGRSRLGGIASIAGMEGWGRGKGCGKAVRGHGKRPGKQLRTVNEGDRGSGVLWRTIRQGGRDRVSMRLEPEVMGGFWCPESGNRSSRLVRLRSRLRLSFGWEHTGMKGAGRRAGEGKEEP